ncbi:MAG TPA: hypothetical protein VEX39_06650 [Thermoleophilaceae bacterium]|nr:hypothetical protein [Thermoleophilaceae bacterium]
MSDTDAALKSRRKIAERDIPLVGTKLEEALGSLEGAADSEVRPALIVARKTLLEAHDELGELIEAVDVSGDDPTVDEDLEHVQRQRVPGAPR